MRIRRILPVLILAAGGAALRAAETDRPDNSREAEAGPTKVAVAPAEPPSGIAEAARQPFAGAAWKGPAPRPLPGAVRLKPVPNAGRSSIPKSARERLKAEPAGIRPDGQRGFVELLPPPPEYDQGTNSRDSRYFELPPAPES